MSAGDCSRSWRQAMRIWLLPLLLGVVVVGVGACGASSDGTGAGNSPAPPTVSPTSVPTSTPRTVTFTRVLDLSHEIAPDIPLWPGDPKIVFKTVATMENDGYYLRSFTIGEHSATHMNAPNSFNEGGKAITSYKPEQLVVPAAVIDVRDKCAADPDYQLQVDDVRVWEAANGRLEAGTLVIMYTGWQDKWSDPKAFFNIDKKGNLHFPGFAGATTKWLLDQRDIAGVGIDTHGVDPGLDTTYATNTEVTGAQKIVLECLAHLDQMPATGATLILGILRLKDGSGCPLAVTALVP